MPSLSEVQEFISNTKTQRDSYYLTLVKVRKMLGITDPSMYTETALQNLLDEYNALKGGSTPPTPTPVNPDNIAGFAKIYEEQFDVDCAEGEFLTKYGKWWKAYPSGWKDTSKRGNYNPNIISVRNGNMFMRLHTLNGIPQVCAPMPQINGNGVDLNQLYGRYEVRFRADAVDGYKTAWLLWPKSEVWPRDGEIDFPEGDLTGTINAFMHRQNGTSGGDQDHFGSNARFTDWHTAALEWEPTRCAFILDGKTLGVSTSRVPNTPMRWVLQTETKLSGAVPTTATGNVQIDYVKVWRRA